MKTCIPIPTKRNKWFPLFVLFLLLKSPSFSQSVWSELGAANPLNNGATILTLTSDPSGNIYAAGWVTVNGTERYVARWDRLTDTWNPLGGASHPLAYDNIHSVVSDTAGNIYFSLPFMQNSNVQRIAKWNKLTNQFTNVGDPAPLEVNNWIYSIAVDTPGNVYAGGLFYNSSLKNYVAKWDVATNTWGELGGNNSLQVSGSIHNVILDQAGNVYAAGTFTNANGRQYVAKWDKVTNTWSELGGTNSLQANNTISDLAVDAGDNIYAVGYFTNASGRHYVTKWDKITNTWSELGGNNSLQANGLFIRGITIVGNDVYVSGDFTNSGGNRYVAKWDNIINTWSELGGNNSLQANQACWAITNDPYGEIYTAGNFYNGSLRRYVAHFGPVLTITSVTPSSGCSGTPISITGRGFTGATAVTIGGTPVSSFTVVSPQLITAIAGPGTSGIVSVTTPLGTATYNGFSFVAPVTPALNIAANTTVICAGTPVTFTATPTFGGTSPIYQWKKNGVNTGTNSAVYTDNTLNNGDVISCLLTSNHPCIAANNVTSNAITVTVNPAVTPAVSISASANNICKGTPVSFTATATGGNTTVYQWKKNGSNVGNNTNTYSDPIPANGDLISCAITVTGTCLSTPTATSNIIQMNVFPTPVVGLDHSGILCEGVQRILDAGNFSSYLWNDGSSNSTLTVNSIGVYSVIVTDNNGCNGYDTVRITTVSPRPANFLPADTSVCSYGSLTLSTRSNYQSYLWNDNSVQRSLVVTQPGLYWVDITDNNNCRGRDSVLVTLKECIRGFFIPSAFTPNNDGINDLLKPLLYGSIKKYHFLIYNRWGELVFESTDVSKGWDGTMKGMKLDAAVFVWMCSYQFEGESEKFQKGTVSLIR